MEASHEEFVGSSNDNNNNQTHHMIVKGKRTKRQRPSSPLMSSSSSSACGGGGGDGGGRGDEYGNSFSSPTTSGGDVYESTEEEEDMANCLIMLAQGNYRHHQPQQQQQETVEVQKLIASNASTNKGGLFVYECKTCNRTFPSFQALGGHRASHKKPKTALAMAIVDVKKPAVATEELEDNHEEHVLIFNKNLQKLGSSTTNKVHECSICGSEFTSGQALGGHMRRHRAVATVPPNMNITTSIAVPTSGSAFAIATTKMVANSSSLCDDMEITKRRRPNILPLDLNLPAPEDDHRSGPEAKFALVFSASALVDCHY